MSIISWPYRWLALLALVAAAFGSGFFKGDQHRGRVDERDLAKLHQQWDAERAAQAASVQAQTARNLELQRSAEEHYTVTREGQDRYFVTTTKEIVHDAAPLAACPVPDAVRVRLNAAAACARADSPTACGTPDEVPRTR